MKTYCTLYSNRENKRPHERLWASDAQFTNPRLGPRPNHQPLYHLSNRLWPQSRPKGIYDQDPRSRRALEYRWAYREWSRIFNATAAPGLWTAWLASNGNVILKLKTPYSNGTIHINFSPLEFIEKLAVLVPRPIIHLPRDLIQISSLAKNESHVEIEWGT